MSGEGATAADEVVEAAGQLVELLENLSEVQKLLEADPENAELTALRDEIVSNVEDLKKLVETAADATAAPAGSPAGADDRGTAEPGEDAGAAAVAGPSLPPGSSAGAGQRAVRPHSGAEGNKGIHPRSIYSAGAPDFADLAKKQKILEPFLIHGKDGKAYIDFKSFEATRALTCALLKEDYGITWWLPEGHLCPTMTNRTNYIHWLEDLIATSGPPVSGTVRGIDIGTGANAIYALLGAAMNGWHMVGTDVTDAALSTAKMNVTANPHLSKLIELRDARIKDKPGDSFVLEGVICRGDPPYAFCMCNPPFFESIEEAGQNPNTACGGSLEEMVYPGGELAFVKRIVADSWRLQKRVWWYTTMVGKKSTLKTIMGELRRPGGPPALRQTELSQGKTTRWCIAWSFTREAAEGDRKPLAREPTQALDIVKPCSKASATLNVGREKTAAVLALQEIAKAAKGIDEIADSKMDTAAFALTCTLSVGGAGAPPDPKRPKGAEGDAPVPSGGKGKGPSFTATVLQSAPGELTVKANVLGDAAGDLAACTAFARAFAGLTHALREKWPQMR